jgi:hypothetical protein
MTTLNEHAPCVTPAGGGVNITGTGAAPTSLAARFADAGAGVSEPPTADDSPPEVRSDEIDVEEIFDWSLEAGGGVKGLDLRTGTDDDSDPEAFPRSRRLICSASTDGQTTIYRFGDVGIVLTADETREVYEFLANSARIWGGALL